MAAWYDGPEVAAALIGGGVRETPHVPQNRSSAKTGDPHWKQVVAAVVIVGDEGRAGRLGGRAGACTCAQYPVWVLEWLE